MSDPCPRDWKQCHRGYCAREMRCAEHDSSMPAERPATLASQAQQPAPADLHGQIMNLPCNPPATLPKDQWFEYRCGHRDARHAAAELAAAAAVQPSVEPPWRAILDSIPIHGAVNNGVPRTEREEGWNEAMTWIIDKFDQVSP